MSARRLLYAFAVVLVVVCAAPLRAQNCDGAFPFEYRAVTSCTTNPGGMCSAGSTVGFSLRRLWSDTADLKCATVEWDFKDGSPVVIVSGDKLVEHTFATAGRYDVQAVIRTTSYPWAHSNGLSVLVGNGRVSVDASRMVEEGQSTHFIVRRNNIVGDTEVAWQLRTFKGAPVTEVTPSSGTVTLPAGSTAASFTVNTADDSVFTGSRTYLLFLTSATGGYVAPAEAVASLEIVDDDFTVVDAKDSPIVVAEDAGVATVHLKRNGDLGRRIAVNFEVAGDGVMHAAGMAIFESGKAETSVQFIVLDDAVRRPRTPFLRLQTFETGVRFANRHTSTSLPIIIEDDEPPIVIDTAPHSVLEGDEGLQRLDLRIVLSAPATETFSIFATVQQGTATHLADYTAPTSNPSAWVTFSAGSVEETVRLFIRGDEIPERDETVLVTLSQVPWDNRALPVVLPDEPLVLTIINDDIGLGPSPLRIPRGSTGQAFLDIGAPAATDLVVPLVSADPAAIAVPASITIPAGKSQATFEVTGHTAGAWARITATLPSPHGEKSIRAEVYEPVELVLDPPSLQLHPGQEVTVRATFDPPSVEARTIALQVLDAKIATAPKSVDIPTGGVGTFVVKGLAPGGTSITATLPEANGGGIRTLAIVVETSPDAPALRSIVPSTGPSAGGTPFEANGAHLNAGCTLRFGGVPATDVVLVNDGLLTGVTPAHAAGAVDVTLQCGGQTFALANAFTYVAAKPTLSTVAPSFGSTAGGTHVRVIGTNIRSGCWLFFGGTASPAVETHGTTGITGVTPPRTNPGVVDVALRCSDATATLPAAFAYTNADEPSASIISIAPLAGAPGETLTITGSRFRPADRITFDDAAATILRTAPDTHVVRIPELPLGTSSITLTEPGGRATTTGPIFAVLEPERPQIATVSPSTAVAGAELVLTGRAFRPAYSFAVGTAAQLVDMTSERVVIRLAGDLAPGTYPIHLRNAAGQLAIVGPPIIIVEHGVAVRGVEPACGSSDGGTLVTITGTGFAPGATVAFNDVAATSVEVISATEIRAVVPAGATGLARITVQNANGDEGALTHAFRYRSPFDPVTCAGAPTRGRSVRH